MTGDIIESMLDSLDINKLSHIERVDYNRFRITYPKRLSLLKVIHRNSKNLSYDLKVINELILGNEHKKDID